MSNQWKSHPRFEKLQIKEDGSELKFDGKSLNIRDHRGKTGKTLKIVYFNRSQYSVPKLILETYKGLSPEGRYYATYKDGNIENLHPDNLYWSKTHKISKERKFENDLKLSKLTKDQTYSALVSNSKGIPISKIAKNYNVSDMTVYRAIQRLKRKIRDKE
ncbi:helix-turn-helix domain-containing protein [Christiangramia sabulilitoris]|uniref:Helix-turn-helix domain-containing protein n=1 Tax=Christiangramia sabulilitoris TaxID=2583991 RepID=A0A550HZ40_9FLAO|nr:helix-turn-helix domain-containing protein [Christiangramia sabulilitoris]TRO63985.1 helix-turn-helix domain-containing protein [Christiangramia sabulilitoris]